MKYILKFMVIGLLFSSCTDLTEFNDNPKKPEAVPASGLVGNATVELFDLMSSTNVNDNNFRLWAQHWAQVSYSDESNYELVERNVNGRTFNTMYASVLRDLNEAKAVINDDISLQDAVKANQLAITDVLEVVTMTTLVDIFGDMPYSEAFTEDVTPKYDDDATIYDAMLIKLDAAIGTLSGDAGNIGDLIYDGNADAWKVFANSYKLRLAIRLADGDDARAKSMAEAAVSSGVFTSSADNFAIEYESSPPNTNPVWEDLVQSGRSDFVAVSTLVNRLNDLEDPRRQFFFKQNLVDSLGVVSYAGGVAGAVNSFTANSQIGSMLESETLPGVIMSYTEVSFLLADAAERGYDVGGTAADHYTAAVTESILEWGGSSQMAEDYLDQDLVDYATASGTWKEKIALQKWIALFNQGFEAWTTYRIYDAPELDKAEAAGTTPPFRYTYPVTEYSINKENVEAAGAAMGGDDLYSKIFWDVN